MICITPDQSVRGHLLSKYMIKNNEELLESFLQCLNNSKGIKINYKRLKIQVLEVKIIIENIIQDIYSNYLINLLYVGIQKSKFL